MLTGWFHMKSRSCFWSSGWFLGALPYPTPMILIGLCLCQETCKPLREHSKLEIPPLAIKLSNDFRNDFGPYVDR
jgi:hypothetical protein